MAIVVVADVVWRAIHFPGGEFAMAFREGVLAVLEALKNLEN